MISTITVNGQTIDVVTVPSALTSSGTPVSFASVEFSFSDAVALFSSPFTGETQAQQWPGADMWSGTMTLPAMTQATVDPWIAFLMQLRGMANAFLLGDPLKANPAGNPLGDPAIPGTVTDAAGSQVLHTVGWQHSNPGNLLPGDYIQVGYRLHRVLDSVDSDASGNATINIWPSLRETPIANAPLILSNCVGLFRRANNKGTWSADYTRLSHMSFQVMEYR